MERNTAVEEVDAVTKKLTVSIPASELDSEVKSELTKVAQQAHLKGFRPGKAPLPMVEKLHGGRVRVEVAQRLISASVQAYVVENKIDMVGYPDIDIETLESGKDLKFTANLSTFPEPELKDYTGLTVEVPKKEISDDDVNEIINDILRSRATFKAVEGREVVEPEDVIEADVTITIDEESAERPEPVKVALGEGGLPEDLEKGIVGMKVGEAKDIVANFPVDHANQQLAGKEANFHVDLKGISQRELPELTDDFAAEFDKEVKTALELKVKIREQLEKGADNEAKAEAQVAVLDKVLENNDFPVPQIMIDTEIKEILVRQGLVDAQKVNVQELNVEPFRQGLGEAAAKRVRTAVAIDRIADQEKIEVVESDIDEWVKDFSAGNNFEEKDVRDHFLNGEKAEDLKRELQRNKTLDFLIEKSKVSYTAKEDPSAAAEEQPTKKTTAKKKKAAKKEAE